MNKCVTGLVATSAILGALAAVPIHASATTVMRAENSQEAEDDDMSADFTAMLSKPVAWTLGMPKTLQGKYTGGYFNDGFVKNWDHLYIKSNSISGANYTQYHTRKVLNSGEVVPGRKLRAHKNGKTAVIDANTAYRKISPHSYKINYLSGSTIRDTIHGTPYQVLLYTTDRIYQRGSSIKFKQFSDGFWGAGQWYHRY